MSIALRSKLSFSHGLEAVEIARTYGVDHLIAFELPFFDDVIPIPLGALCRLDDNVDAYEF